MKKILNTLLYGDSRTKRYLWSILILLLLSFGCAIAFLFTFSFRYIIGVVLGMIVAAIMASNVSFREMDATKKEEKKTSPPVFHGAEPRSAGREDTFGKKTDANRELPEEKKEWEADKPEANKTKQDVKTKTTTELSQGDKDKDKDKSSENPNGISKEDEEYLLELQKHELKTLMFKYKVKKTHYPILIERCDSLKLKQCPAYVWVRKGMLHFLFLAANTKNFELPLSKVSTLTAERGVRAFPKEEYLPIKEAKLIASAFAPMLPSYYIATDERGRRSNRKNCYHFGKDIVVTPHSARVLRKLTQARFVLLEEEKMINAYGSFATEAYKYKYLWQDEALSLEEYKEEIRILLQQMVEAELSDYEFEKNIHLMVKKQLITEEYAKFYQDQKNERNKQA